MGLSNTGNGSDLTSLQVALDIASSLSILAKDPKALEKAATESYAITEREQRKAQEARDSIEQNEAILNETRALKRQVEADTAANIEKAAQLSEEWKRLGKEAAELKKWEAEVKKQSEEVRAAKSAVTEREQAVEVRTSKLNEATATLEKKQKEILEYETSLKEKAAQLQKLTQGL